MELITVFARKEPTTDDVTLKYGPQGKKDTVFYRDRDCKHIFVRKPWYQSGQPTKATKTVQLNCFRWAVQWLEQESNLRDTKVAQQLGNKATGGV